MAFLIDTSALIHLLRDKTGQVGPRFDALVTARPTHLSRITQFELLKGAKTDAEWTRLLTLFDGRIIFDLTPAGWIDAARIAFDLRRVGLTLKNSIDCAIAQSAIENRLTLVHDDNDFELIAQVRQLNLARFRASIQATP